MHELSIVSVCYRRTLSSLGKRSKMKTEYRRSPRITRPHMRSLWFAVYLAATPPLLVAQRATAPGQPLEVGAVAPDFTMNGATRYGVLAHPIHLSDFKGKTVVLAFFFKARTSG